MWHWGYKESILYIYASKWYKKGEYKKILYVFLIKDEGLLEAYKKIWNRVRNLIEKGIETEPVYNKEELKSKMTAWGQEKYKLS